MGLVASLNQVYLGTMLCPTGAMPARQALIVSRVADMRLIAGTSGRLGNRRRYQMSSTRL